MERAAKQHMPASEKARVLAEALPFMQRYDGQTIVIKFGGNAMGDDKSLRQFAADVALLRQSGISPVVVHGGGPQIGKMLSQLGVESKFSKGLRVTDARTMEVAEMVLCGTINNQLVSAIQACGGRAVGCSGKDGGMILASRLGSGESSHANAVSDSRIEEVVDLGFVGKPTKISTKLLHSMMEGGFIPVVAPVGVDEGGQTLNINADIAAGAIAAALGAKRLLLLSDVSGVADANGTHFHKLSEQEARQMIRDERIYGGMIPKVETGFEALHKGVDGVVVLDGRLAHAILMELFTPDGCGTLLTL